MKKLFLLIAILASVLFVDVQAQTNGFNYKALITQNGNALVNHSVSVRFTILQNGTQVYQETQTTTTDANGIISLPLGESSTHTGDFSSIDWSNGPYSLKVEVNTGSGYQDYGTKPLKYVPFAKYAETSGDATHSLNDLDDAVYTGKSLFLGENAGVSDDGSNNENVGIGLNALNANTSGYRNTAVGDYAMQTNSTGHDNVAIGI